MKKTKIAMSKPFFVFLFEVYRVDTSLQAATKTRSALCWKLLDSAPKAFFRGGNKVHVDLLPTEHPFVFVGTSNGKVDDIAFYISLLTDTIALFPVMSAIGIGTYASFCVYFSFSVRPGGDEAKAVDEAISTTLLDFDNKSAHPCWRASYFGQMLAQRKAGAKSKAVESNTSQPSEKTKHVDEGCTICMAAPADTAFVHGGDCHKAACNACATKIMESTATCPVCRADVERLMRVFDQ